MSFTSNGDADAGFEGHFWGAWTLPASDCEGTWEGTWWAERTRLPLPGMLGVGLWVGDIHLLGHGRGCLRGLVMNAHELAMTNTPVPAAYEMYCPTCGPEGAMSGSILRLGRRH